MPTVGQHRTKIRKALVIDTREKIIESTNTSMRLDVPIWKNVHPALELGPDDVGKSVAIASEALTFSAILSEIREDGNLDITVLDRKSKRGVNSGRVLYADEVILHPDELTEERLEANGEEVYDGRS